MVYAVFYSLFGLLAFVDVVAPYYGWVQSLLAWRRRAQIPAAEVASHNNAAVAWHEAHAGYCAAAKAHDGATFDQFRLQIADRYALVCRYMNASGAAAQTVIHEITDKPR